MIRDDLSPSRIALLTTVGDAVLKRGATCALNISRSDVPKLYAVHQPSGGTGPHEIVSAGGQLDVWTSPDGRNPEPLAMNITTAQAVEYVVKDYQHLKTEYIRRVQP